MNQRMDLTAELGIVRGEIELLILDARTRKVKDQIRSENLILTAFRPAMFRALFNDSGTIGHYLIDRIGWGTSNAVEDPGDLALADEEDATVTAYATSTYTFAATASLGAGQGNGTTFREMGLLMADNTLLSRRVIAARTKDAESIWTATWTLTFTPVTSGSALFLDMGYQALFAILAGESASAVTAMQFGTGLDDPDMADTRLQFPVSPIKTLASAVIAGATATASAYLLSGDANGFTIAEIGLRTGSGLLVTRGRVSEQAKTADYQFEGQFLLT